MTAALLLSLAAKSVAVFAVGAAVSALLRRSSASVRHGVWAVTFAAALAVPALDALGPSWGVPVLPASEHPVSTVGPLGDRSAVPLGPGAVSTDEDPAPGLAAWLGGLWLLGSVIVGVRWLRAYALGRRLVRASRVVDDGVWAARVRAAASAAGFAGPVRLRVSDALAVPVAWGWGRPSVLLPSRSRAWDEDRAHAVLAHEVAHLRRRDAWTQALAHAALAVHWPNPLAWAAYRRLRAERERACDDAVLASGTPPPSYAAHLVAVARELRAVRPAPPALAALVAPGELEGRVRAVLDVHRQRGRAGRVTTRAVVALALAFGVPLAAVQPVAGPRPSEAVAPPRPDAVEAAVVPLRSENIAAVIPLSEATIESPGGDLSSESARRDEPGLTRPGASGDGPRRDTTDEARRPRAATGRADAAVEREAARVEREAARLRRDVHAAERAASEVERQAAAVEREKAAVRRQHAAYEREAARADREAAALEREGAAVRREAARVRRGAARLEREPTGRERRPPRAPSPPPPSPPPPGPPSAPGL